MANKEYKFGNLTIVYEDEITKAYSYDNKIMELDEDYITINAEFLGTGDTLHHKPTAHYRVALKNFYEDTDTKFSITKEIYDKARETINAIIVFKSGEALKYTNLCSYDRRSILGEKLDRFINDTLGHKGFYSGGSNWCQILLTQWI